MGNGALSGPPKIFRRLGSIFFRRYVLFATRVEIQDIHIDRSEIASELPEPYPDTASFAHFAGICLEFYDFNHVGAMFSHSGRHGVQRRIRFVFLVRYDFEFVEFYRGDTNGVPPSVPGHYFRKGSIALLVIRRGPTVFFSQIAD